MNPRKRRNFEIINGIEGCEEVLEEDIFEWLDVENQHSSFQILNDEEIIRTVDPSSDINDADNEDQDFEDLRTISHTEGVQALTTALKYLEQRSDVTPIDLLLPKNWRVGQPLIEILDFCTEGNRLF
ncbi:hypothetical protein AVEN_40505-1 [Araneus ventricosus]|uniref:Uncharacterized protein n=1 Tax=Araneus ventricosus TaxID=182803 RepID=A0A4Y2IMJ4_ARAVE|nr:hypothetical protein AVEN_40505-1 [Araneus ventricosus]